MPAFSHRGRGARRGCRVPRGCAVALTALALAGFPKSVARAASPWSAPWLDGNQGDVEERYESGDLDAEDIVGAATRQAPVGTFRLGPTWLALSAFLGQRLRSAQQEGGLLVAVGFPLGRFVPAAAPGPSLATIDESSGSVGQGDGTPGLPVPALAPVVGRAVVRAALRAAGLEGGDERVEAAVARARTAALLPEARLRAMRSQDESARVDTLPDERRVTGTLGADLWLEARLTWRLDRALYHDDEPRLERLRLDVHEARAKVAGRALDALFRWQRARLEEHFGALGIGPDGRGAPTREALEARARVDEAELILDTLTNGWFSAWRGEELP